MDNTHTSRGLLRLERKKKRLLIAYAAASIALSIGLFALVSAAVYRFGWTFDLTESQIYAITDETRQVLSSLDAPVQLIYCNDKNDADTHITEVLSRYERSSDKVSVSYIDLKAHPALVEEWAEKGISLSSDGVLVSSGSRARFIGWSDMYAISSYTDASGSERYSLTGLQAETKLTSAILNVIGEEDKGVAFTLGHSEDVPSALRELVANAGYLTEQTVLGVEEIGSQVTTIVIAGPTLDFSEEEIAILDSFMASGGNLLVFRDPTVSSLPNLDGYLSSWGIEVEDEIVLEPGQQLDSPLNIIPLFGISMINVYFSESSTYLVLPTARALSLSNPNNCITNALLYSTQASYGKDFASMSTISPSDSDTPGPFVVAATSERNFGEEATQYVFETACTGIYDERYLATESLGNSRFILEVLSYFNDTDRTLNIPVKSLSAGEIVLSRYGVMAFTLVFVVLLPLTLLGCGLIVFIKRRHS